MNDHVNLASLLTATIDTLQRYQQIVLIYLAIMVPVTSISNVFSAGDANTIFALGSSFELSESFIDYGPLGVSIALIAFIITVLTSYWLTAALVRGTTAPGFDRLGAYIGIYILAVLAIVFGLILFIIPGIILAVRWMPIMPVVINQEGSAMDSFGDTWQMTSGKGWSIFGAVVIIAIVMMIAGSVIGGLSAFALGPASIPAAIGTALVDEIGTVIYVGLAVGAYNLLRDNAADMTEVFE